MHSVFSLGALALGLLSMTGSVAAVDSAADLQNLVARAPPRGRPNHAHQYGYPHGRGDHSGTRSPPPVGGAPMTPGGYMDPRPPNMGAQCHSDRACSTSVAFAVGRCVRGACSFSCIPGFNNVRGACTPAGAASGKRCHNNAACKTNLANASGLCQGGYCTYQCNPGFYTRGTQCAKTSNTCGGKTCPAVPGGYSVCVRGQCTAQCEKYLGYQLHSDGHGGYTCVNTGHDTNNCGGHGNKCPTPYNHKGRAYCDKGTCQLSCGRLQKLKQPDGSYYCA